MTPSRHLRNLDKNLEHRSDLQPRTGERAIHEISNEVQVGKKVQRSAGV